MSKVLSFRVFKRTKASLDKMVTERIEELLEEIAYAEKISVCPKCGGSVRKDENLESFSIRIDEDLYARLMKMKGLSKNLNFYLSGKLGVCEVCGRKK